MTKQENVSHNVRYLITPSLLNSWGYMWEFEKNVKETENDKVCLEDKIDKIRVKAKEDFLNALNKIYIDNEYMKLGREFEEECYQGKTCLSPIIEGGCNQIVGVKKVTVDGIDFVMYGKLDVLKGGVVYDIKRVQNYKTQKYLNSYQHGFYLGLFPRAYKFEYLIYDGVKPHTETYYRGQYIETTKVISMFIKWLKENNLFEIYKEKWRSKYD